MFATLIVRVTLISRSFLNRKINVSRKFHVIISYGSFHGLLVIHIGGHRPRAKGGSVERVVLFCLCQRFFLLWFLLFYPKWGGGGRRAPRALPLDPATDSPSTRLRWQDIAKLSVCVLHDRGAVKRKREIRQMLLSNHLYRASLVSKGLIRSHKLKDAIFLAGHSG